MPVPLRARTSSATSSVSHAEKEHKHLLQLPQPQPGWALPPALWEVHSPAEIIKYVLGDNVSFMLKLVGLQSLSDNL